MSLYKQKCLFPQIFSSLGIKQLIQEVVNCYIQNFKEFRILQLKKKKKKKKKPWNFCVLSHNFKF